MTRRIGRGCVIASAWLALLLSLAAGCKREAPDAHLVEPTAPSEPPPAAEPEPPSGASIPGEAAQPGADPAQGAPPEQAAPGPKKPSGTSAAGGEPTGASGKTPAPSKPSTPKPSTTASKPAQGAPPAPEPPAPAAPKTAEPKPAEPKPKASVRVPSTKHVSVVYGSGLQALLDADSRMQPWVNNVMRVVGGCYDTLRAKNPEAAGSIAVTVTMHENERPTPDINSLPPQLSEIVACGTGQLMRGPRMPLFTGPEGQRHRLEIRFTP